MAHYDLLVIGTGSGNMFLDKRFARLKTAIAEEWHFGGTCLNVGCIPTKMFVYPATVAEEAAHAKRYDVDASFSGVDWSDLQSRIFSRVDAIEAGGREYRMSDRQPNNTVIPEHVRFVDEKTVITDSGEEITADRIVIAAGASPTIPDTPGLDPARVDTPGYPIVTSNSIMRLPEQPKRLAIVGSGVVAMEFAHIFSSFGTEVTVIARGPRLLQDFDGTASAEFTKIFTADHNVILGAQPAAYRLGEGEGAPVTIDLEPSGRMPDVDLPASVEADIVLIAIGRHPNTEGLDAAAVGYDTTADGRLVVDDFQRVYAGGKPVPGVFALGDISSEHQLKHVANHEARVVGDNLAIDVAAGAPGAAGEETLTRSSHKAVPSAVFTSPQVAAVGMTEDEARAAGHDVTVKVQNYSDVAYGWAMADDPGIAKIIADRDSRLILGAQIVGHEASMIIQPVIQAMAFDQPADEVARGQYWIHPALPEVIENALLGLDFSPR
ncbi:Mycothione reductase [Brevibacterium casei]|uniref:Mycothione reductase n=1 Tax=Brevibacterium casei TaxID=33889 RepID=A0A449D3M4_9MICO|nr:mycothione reductase [Brevibacterium casei]VEW12078.1 Mycothione reductase [Brevibacterium casei]